MDDNTQALILKLQGISETAIYETDPRMVGKKVADALAAYFEAVAAAAQPAQG